MKDKKTEDLLSILDNSQELKSHDKPLDDFVAFVKEINLVPGNYKLNITILYEKYRNERDKHLPKNSKINLKALGFKIDNPRKNYCVIYVSKDDKERLTLEYAQKISEKIY